VTIRNTRATNAEKNTISMDGVCCVDEVDW
jgi:hypothetical protein